MTRAIACESGARKESKMTELEALAVRCEQASGPDRELDALVCAAAGFTVEYDRKHNDPEPYYEPVKDYSWQRVPAYTASLDAAMSLVPTDWHVSINGCNDSWHVRLNETACGTVGVSTGFSTLLCGVLTAASLRAIAGTSQEQEG
jgi:hypothetical protein